MEKAVEQELSNHTTELWSQVKQLRSEVNSKNAVYHKEHAKAIQENKSLLQYVTGRQCMLIRLWARCSHPLPTDAGKSMCYEEKPQQMEFPLV